MDAATANDNPALVRNVRVAASPAPGRPDLFVVRLAGVTEWVMLYDGGVPLARTKTLRPALGEWAIDAAGWPVLAAPPVRTLTADVVGADLPPSHVFRPDEIAVWTVDHRGEELFAAGLIKVFPDQTASHLPTSPTDQLATAITLATAAGQFEVVGKLSDTLKAVATAEGLATAQSAAAPGTVPNAKTVEKIVMDVIRREKRPGGVLHRKA